MGLFSIWKKFEPVFANFLYSIVQFFFVISKGVNIVPII